MPAICFSRLCFRLVKSWVTETFFNPFTGFCQIHCNVTLVPSVLRGEQLPRESDTSALQELGMPLDTRTAGMPHLARKLFLTTMLPTRPIWRHCARAPHQASSIKIAPGTGRHWMRCCAWLPRMADSRLLRPNCCIFLACELATLSIYHKLDTDLIIKIKLKKA